MSLNTSKLFARARFGLYEKASYVQRVKKEGKKGTRKETDLLVVVLFVRRSVRAGE